MLSRPIKVTIAYCSECGYQPQTIALAGALLQTFEYGLSSVELIPWHDGSFEVSVAGDLVHSMYREGGFPEHSTIIQAVRDRLNASAGTTEGEHTPATTSQEGVR